jgi:hypothetical protein
MPQVRGWTMQDGFGPVESSMACQEVTITPLQKFVHKSADMSIYQHLWLTSARSCILVLLNVFHHVQYLTHAAIANIGDPLWL